jgi:Cu-Zn family superoxide dismutase
VFDADGSALIVHAGSDYYNTDPPGDAGGRIACGVVQ